DIPLVNEPESGLPLLECPSRTELEGSKLLDRPRRPRRSRHAHERATCSASGMPRSCCGKRQVLWGDRRERKMFNGEIPTPAVSRGTHRQVSFVPSRFPPTATGVPIRANGGGTSSSSIAQSV